MIDAKKILVIQTAFPGDAILTLPFIQELKKKHPGVNIDVLCIPSTVGIFSASPSVTSVIIFDKRGKQKSFLSFLKFVKNLKHIEYQVVYSPHRSFRSALITLLLSPENSYGYDNSSLPFVFRHTIKYEYSVHEVARNLKFIDTDYSGDKWKIIPEIEIPEESKIKVQEYLSSNKINKFVAIAPGSVWETKKYPTDYFNKIIDYFTDSKYQIVLMGGKEDKELCESLTKNDSSVFISAGNFSFIESIELLKHSSLLICNDSAPTHLGICADIPVLTIYCSTTPDFGFYPYNLKSDYLSYDDLNCKPCGIHGFENCPLDHFNCGKLLLPEVVIKKAENLLTNAH